MPTSLNGINNAGDFVGHYYGITPALQGFISVGGKVRTLDIPGASVIEPEDLNSLNQVAGFYIDSSDRGTRAFYSDANGELQYPVEVRGNKSTSLFGINDQGVMVGSYETGKLHAPVVHGLVFVPPDQFVTVNYRGGSGVTLTGINNQGIICGYYTDRTDNNKVHGLIAQLRGSSD